MNKEKAEKAYLVIDDLLNDGFQISVEDYHTLLGVKAFFNNYLNEKENN